MKRLLVLCAAGSVLLASAAFVLADIARPKSSPATQKENRIVFHTGLTVVTDGNLSEARLQISEESLRNLRQALGSTTPANPSLLQRVSQSPTSTIMAGLFMFLSVSFAGVWLARSGVRRSHKMVAAFLLAASLFGAATILTRANAGPPGYYRWRNLAENLGKGQPTSGGLDIEIVPGTDTMKLIVPLRKAKGPGEE